MTYKLNASVRLSKKMFEGVEFELEAGRLSFVSKTNSIACNRPTYGVSMCGGCKLLYARSCCITKDKFIIQCIRTHKHPELFL